MPYFFKNSSAIHVTKVTLKITGVMKKVILSIFALSIYISTASQNIATITGNNVEIDNGTILVSIKGGSMTKLKRKGQTNLIRNGGIGYFSYNDNAGFYAPSNSTPQIKINNTEIADIYYVNNASFAVEMHYVFRSNESGFYTYFVISDNGQVAKTMAEIRFALRVDKEVFDYAWTVEREGAMVSPEVLENYVEEIQDATYRLEDGSIYTKYDWSVDRYKDTHHGLLGNGAGLWTIEASREYVNGGPSMQDLTLHGTSTTPILLTSFNTLHYGSANIVTEGEYETFSKLWGPAFTYINTGTNEEIIADAKTKASELQAQWPYSWLDNELYPIDRGVMTGTLELNGGGDIENARVFLSKKGPISEGVETDWQFMPYDYFFATECDASGNFSIEDIIPGTYNLYAYTQQGKLIDELKQEGIVIAEGANNVGNIIWDAGDKAQTIFQIGTADHKSGEFKLADLPRLYGRWFDTPLSLTYNTETDNPRDNWYYCQQENSSWEIQFPIENKIALIDPILKIALAGTDAKPNIEVWVNGQKITTMLLGTDSAIRRSSLTAGKFTQIDLPIDTSLLLEGANTILLNCIGSEAPYKGIMYDAVLLEANINPELSMSEVSFYKQVYAYSKNGVVYIQSNSETSFTAKIYTSLGMVLEQMEIHKGLNQIQIDSKGLLLLELSNGNYKQTLKLIHT